MGADRYLSLYAAVSAIAVSLLIYSAITARSKVLSSNPCRMTYSNPAMTKIPLCGEGCGHQLWKVSNPDSKKLNRQPVLYIPGSMGSYKQARSLASHMHNEDAYFQYFAMDFEGGSSSSSISLSAVHGSEVTSQAYSTNRALHKIRSLYQKSSNESLHIILVGHSIGGVVARGSLLLPNHPHCVVKIILQLSSPNQRPPYALDASLDSVYQAINSGWDAANLNSTKSRPISECGNWTGEQQAAQDPRAYLPSADFYCPRCASSVRVVSISGGAIDWQVRPDLSSLQGLLPRTEQALRFQRRAMVAHYRSLTAAGRGGGGGGNYSLLGSAYYAARAVLHCALGPVQCGLRLVGLGGGNSLSTNSTDTSSIDAAVSSAATVEVGDNVTAAVAGPDSTIRMDPALDRRFSFGRLHSNRFLSARTSQLQGVGFPVDHAAIVWCFELLQVLSRSMRTLSSLPSDADINWNQVFPLKHHREDSPLNNASFIPDAVVDGDEEEEEDRDIVALRQEWIDAAKVEEQLMFGDGMQWPWLAKASSDFISGHLLAVAACVLIVSSLVGVAPYLQLLTGNTPRSGSSHWAMPLLPSNHLQVQLLCTALFQLGQAVLPRSLLPELFHLSAYAILVAVLCKAGWDLLFLSHEAVFQTVMTYCYWLLAYCLAIAINAALMVFILACRSGFGYAVYATRIALRYTVWNRFVRRCWRLFVKWLRQVVPVVDALARTGARHAVLIALLVTWCTVWGLSSPIVIDRIRVRIHQLLSSLIITSYIALSMALLQALLHSPYSHCENAPSTNLHQHYTAMTALYLPAPLLAMPNLLYAFASLYSHPNNPLHSVAVINSNCLDWDRAISLLVLGFIAVHLRLLRVDRVQRLNLSEKPLGLLYEMVGPPAVQQYGEVFAVHVEEDRADKEGVVSGVISATCLHEDGGRYAEYERIDDATALVEGVEHDEVAEGVVLGSTYKVVHCNCAGDYSLKDQSEWCSWCTCRKCGGKHLPSQDSYDRSHRFFSAYELNDISSALIPVLAVVITAWVLLSWDLLQYKPYYYLHTLGILSLSYIVRYYMLL